MPDHPEIAVVILNWNGKEFLKQFLQGVVDHSPEATVYIADNASTDGSLLYLKDHFPQVSVIALHTNEGFAKGYNTALSQIRADYYVLLNQDVEVAPGWIAPIIRLMESDKQIAACQPKIRAFHQKTHFEYAGAAGGWIDKWGYTFCRGRIFDTLEEDKGQYDDTTEIFWASGASLFIRAELFHEFGGQDEDFFAHMEEIDLCWRLKNGGYKIMCCSQSVVWHVGGGSLPRGNPRKTFLNFRNNLAMLCKNLPASRLWPVLMIRLLLDGLAGFRFLLSGKLGSALAVLRAHFAFYAAFPKILAKRRKLRKNRASGQPSCIYPRSIVADYFFRGKRKFSDLPIE